MIILNGQPINPTIFPDRTSQVWQLTTPILERNHIEWVFEHEGEFMHIAQLKELIDLGGSTACLHMPFLPYARQDKAISNGLTFALVPFSKLINTLNFTAVSSIDPHSEVASILINRFEGISPEPFIHSVIEKVDPDLIFYPDEPASRRYEVNLPFSYAKKKRNQLTGEIIDYQIINKEYIPAAEILIIDDLCDGGATFIKAAEELHKLKCGEINLYVSHGLFTKGLQGLKDAGISRIFSKEGEHFND